MKKITFLFFTFLFANVFAQQLMPPKGIEFQHTSWKEVLAKAKQENKFVFIDCYASWCGPCKWMAANIFTNDTVGLFYNHNFVNYKLDMEKGEGPSLQPYFKITAFPTYIYFNKNGEPVKREMGGMPAANFIGLAKEALGAAFTLDSMKANFQKHLGDKNFLYNYMLLLQMSRQPYTDVCDAYFKNVNDKELIEKENFETMKQFTNDVLSKEFQNLLKHEADYKTKYGFPEVNTLMLKICNYTIKNSTDKKRIKTANEILQRLAAPPAK